MAEVDDIIDSQPSEVEKRIKDLSGKVRTTAEERDAAKAAQEAAEAKTAEAQRERDFYVSFSDVVSTNPQAKDHKDDILAKVKSGYTVEDATYAVLGKAGKLGTSAKVEETAIAGGSAVIAPSSGGGTKTIQEMTQAERRAQLEQDLVIT